MRAKKMKATQKPYRKIVPKPGRGRSMPFIYPPNPAGNPFVTCKKDRHLI
jgi:hypothetical protein